MSRSKEKIRGKRKVHATHSTDSESAAFSLTTTLHNRHDRQHHFPLLVPANSRATEPITIAAWNQTLAAKMLLLILYLATSTALKLHQCHCQHFFPFPFLFPLLALNAARLCSYEGLDTVNAGNQPLTALKPLVDMVAGATVAAPAEPDIPPSSAAP